MNKTEILQELQLFIDLAGTKSDSYTFNKLNKVKDSLMSLWDQEDLYYEEMTKELSNDYDQQIKEVLNYEETMFNLDRIRI